MGLITALGVMRAGVATLVPAVIVDVFGAIFVVRCVASMKEAAVAATE